MFWETSDLGWRRSRFPLKASRLLSGSPLLGPLDLRSLERKLPKTRLSMRRRRRQIKVEGSPIFLLPSKQPKIMTMMVIGDCEKYNCGEDEKYPWNISKSLPFMIFLPQLLCPEKGLGRFIKFHFGQVSPSLRWREEWCGFTDLHPFYQWWFYNNIILRSRSQGFWWMMQIVTNNQT